MQFGSALIFVLTGGIAVALIMVLRRQSLARKRQRSAYFDRVTPMLSDLRATVVPGGFPRISGQHQGQMFDLQIVPDTLTLRKLPALWLLVTLPQPQPITSSVDLMMRPTGVESFSNFATLPNQIAHPRGFPTDCAIRTDGDHAPIHLPLVAQHMAQLDQDHLKELVITPKGLRLVWLIEEADRGRYLIFRDAEMGRTPLTPQQLAPLLQALITLQTDILSLAAHRAA